MKTVTCSFSKSKSIICTAPDTFYQYPGPVFGAGADGAVFRNIGWRVIPWVVLFPMILVFCGPLLLFQSSWGVLRPFITVLLVFCCGLRYSGRSSFFLSFFLQSMVKPQQV